MTWFRTGSSAKRIRRRQIRQRRVAATASMWERFVVGVGLWPTLAVLVFFACATAIALFGERSLRYEVGQRIDQPIIAKIDFNIEDPVQTEQNRAAARAATPSYYTINQELVARIGAELQKLYQVAKASDDFSAYADEAAKAGFPTDEDAYNELRRLGDDAGGKEFNLSITRLQHRLRKEYTARPTSAEDRHPASTAPFVWVRPASSAENDGSAPRPQRVDLVKLIPISNMEIATSRATVLAFTFSTPLQATVRDVLVNMLSAEPMLVFDAQTTAAEMETSAAEVPPVVVSYKRGQQLIVPREEGLTRSDLDLLDLHEARVAAFMSSEGPEAHALRRMRYLQQAGFVALFGLLTVGLFGYVGMFQPRVLEVHSRTLAFSGLLLLTLLACRRIDLMLVSKEWTFVPPLVAAAILTIAYQPRFALAVVSLLALMMVFTVGGDLALFVTLLPGLALTVFLLSDIRSRTRIISVGCLAALTIAVASFGAGLSGGQELSFVIHHAGWAASAAIMAALITHGTLPFIERAFGIATPLTLMEWRDANKAPLQRLAREAPGTYNHSLVLGTMSAAACDAIGADGLLAQVGALYHDIGKIHKPDYFAENQEASINRHDNLAPTMSVLIIVGHVKDGIETAKEYGLPRAIYPFIAEHHGTTVVRYFHHRASQQQPQVASGKHDREVSETEFRYPGPKPRTRETAILMLCDGVEGAVRALPDPTAGRIEGIVHHVLMDRLNDGQFEDCDISLKELHRVEESLVKSLCTFYHGRMAYPRSAKSEQEAKVPTEVASAAHR